MTSNPTGTVTFLFTDIEGSTELARERPDKWESLRARHHEILQSAVDAHNGYVFQIIGDGFCVAFSTVIDGLNAALDAQRKLQYEDWEETPIRVRMGLHTGSAELHDTIYRGYLTMAKVQRVMSVAYGGQVLLSNTSAELLHNEPSKGITLRDMKEHRLKGLPDPEHLWQIVAPDLQQDFPHLQTLTEIPNNLPVQLTSFIGREKEVGQIKRRLEKNRLVTLTGSGGVGKTRLAIKVASELLEGYSHGVWLVELASVTDSSLVTQTICTVLGVKPQGNTPALNVLMDYLRSKKLLLVMDNCEHLIDACAQISESLLHACPNLYIIASSREALGIDGENTYRVPSLSLSESNSSLQVIEESEAVKLFLERANAAQPDFELTDSNAPVIVQICQRLDGIALAIELAASRVKLLKVEQIASRLDDGFRLLTGGSRTALPRQRTLRGAIDWSYKLLSDEERVALIHLSVFVGGWTLDAAEVVCDNPNILDILTHLVDKSLVAVDHEHGDEARYSLLETIRQYASEKLTESGEGGQARARHLGYYLALAKRAEPQLYSHAQIEWLQKLDYEHKNMRAALEWSLQEDVTAGQQLAIALWWYWNLRSFVKEGHDWLMRMLHQVELMGLPPDLKSKALYRTAHLAHYLGEPVSQRRALLQESLDLNQKLRDYEGCSYTYVFLAWQEKDPRKAKILYDEALRCALKVDNAWLAPACLMNMAELIIELGEYEQALSILDECVQKFRKLGDRWGIAWSLLTLAEIYRLTNKDDRAPDLLSECLNLFDQLSYRVGRRLVLLQQANLAFKQGNYSQASELFENNLTVARELGLKNAIATGLFQLGKTISCLGDYQYASAILVESLKSCFEQDKLGQIPACLVELSKVNVTLGNVNKAIRLFGAADALRENLNSQISEEEQAEHSRSMVRLRSILSETDFNALWAEGRTMTVAQAIKLASETGNRN